MLWYQRWSPSGYRWSHFEKWWNTRIQNHSLGPTFALPAMSYLKLVPYVPSYFFPSSRNAYMSKGKHVSTTYTIVVPNRRPSVQIATMVHCVIAPGMPRSLIETLHLLPRRLNRRGEGCNRSQLWKCGKGENGILAVDASTPMSAYYDPLRHHPTLSKMIGSIWPSSSYGFVCVLICVLVIAGPSWTFLKPSRWGIYIYEKHNICIYANTETETKHH